MCTLIRASRLVTWTRAWQMQQRKGLKLGCSSWEAMLVSNEFVVVQRPKSACCYSVEAAQNRLFRHFLRFWKLLSTFNVFCEFSIDICFSLALAWTSAFWVHDGPFPGLLDTFQYISSHFAIWGFVVGPILLMGLCYFQFWPIWGSLWSIDKDATIEFLNPS